MSEMADPYVVEFRVHNPVTLETHMISMPGRNRLHCAAKAAQKFNGCVVTDVDLELVSDSVD